MVREFATHQASAKGPALRQNAVVANGLRVFRCANRNSALLPTAIDYHEMAHGIG